MLCLLSDGVRRSGMRDQNDDIPEVVWSLLCYHGEGNDTPEQTLNRLFQRNWRRCHPNLCDDLPSLRAEMLIAREELWTTDDLGRLDRLHFRSNPRGPDDLPIIVVLYKGVYCLIDGHTRINKWVAERNDEKHPVYVLKVMER